jgi:hypothetical protein
MKINNRCKKDYMSPSDIWYEECYLECSDASEDKARALGEALTYELIEKGLPMIDYMFIYDVVDYDGIYRDGLYATYRFKLDDNRTLSISTLNPGEWNNADRMIETYNLIIEIDRILDGKCHFYSFPTHCWWTVAYDLFREDKNYQTDIRDNFHVDWDVSKWALDDKKEYKMRCMETAKVAALVKYYGGNEEGLTVKKSNRKYEISWENNTYIKVALVIPYLSESYIKKVIATRDLIMKLQTKLDSQESFNLTSLNQEISYLHNIWEFIPLEKLDTLNNLHKEAS